MATSVPDVKIQALRDTKPHGQAVRSGSPTARSPIDGASSESPSSSSESTSPSSPPVVPQVVGARPSQSDQARPSGQVQVLHRRVAAREDTQTQDERFCIMLWVLGASLSFPLVLSAWLYLVPLAVHANWTMPPPPFSPSPPLSASTPFPSTTVVPPTNTSACLAPVMLPAVPPNLNVSVPSMFGPSNESSRPIFCVFNNTRVYGALGSTPPRWNYVFATVPFALCPHVVYWSVGIENGNLTSRQPAFDELYGLQRLRAVADALNFSDVKILVALGGYPEDAPHFSMLGRDSGTLHRMLFNVFRSLNRLGVNGVTVHWVEARAGCQGPSDDFVISVLLRGLRIQFGRKPGALVTVMLEVNAASQSLARETAHVVDYFFLATQNVRSQSWSNINDFCNARTVGMHDAYRWFASALPATTLRRSQLCLTDSLLPFHSSVDLGPTLSVQYAKDFRRGPLYLECDWPDVCEVRPIGSSCLFHFSVVKQAPGLRDDPLMVIDDMHALWQRLDFATINAPQLASAPGDPHACVLLLDMEGDNYADQCDGRFYRYALMYNYYYGTLGKSLSGGGAIRGSHAQCQPW